MAPQTRSRVSDGGGRVSYHEPPLPSSPSTTKTTMKSKVYRRSDPTPQQTHLTARNSTIRTYGKSRRSFPPKPPSQSTLTQIGWIPSTFQDEDDEEDMDMDMNRLNDPTTMSTANDDWKTEERKRRSKRRKTTGDMVPDSTASSSYHTQTLTQMPSFLSGQQPEDDELQGDFAFNDDEETNDHAQAAADEEIYKATPEKMKKYSTSSVTKGKARVSFAPESPTGSIVAQTQTPRKQTVDDAVIPSSQPSPFTPNLGISERYWSALDRTPLKDRSTNVDAPTPTATGKKRSRTLEVADPWSTVNGGMGSSPLKESQRGKRTPLKEIYLDGMGDVSLDLGDSPAVGNGQHNIGEHGVATRTDEAGATPQKSTRLAEEIILDSDDDFGFESEDENPGDEPAPGTPMPLHRASGPATEAVSSERARAPIPSASKTATQSSHHVTRRNPTPEPPAESDEIEPETPSPSLQRRPSISSAVGPERDTPLSSPLKTSPALPPVSQLGSGHKPQVLSPPPKTSAAMPSVSQVGHRYKSQAFESQRVPFEKILRLGPQTDRSDVILSIHPEQADQIVEGLKTHEFRNYRIPQTVGRIWIYVTRPVCELMYMATISVAKQPGEISSEDPGVGNAQFNEGAGTKFAYELRQVYELNNPVSLARMKENGWVEEAPAKYVYVPPAVLGELLGNLRCALFAEPGELQFSQVDMSISQEVAMQLRSDVAHSTQLNLGSSSQQQQQQQALMGDDEEDENVVPSSQAEIASHGDEAIRGVDAPVSDEVVFAKPTIPQSRSQRSVHWIEDSPVARSSRRSQPSQRAANSTVRPSQATTASAPSSPSQQLPPRGPRQRRSQEASIPLSPPTTKSVRRRLELAGSSSTPSYPEDMAEVVGDSPVRRRRRGGRGGTGAETETQTETQLSVVGGGSSQGFGLGEEQDSLLDDSRVRQPPDVVWDSEGDY